MKNVKQMFIFLEDLKKIDNAVKRSLEEILNLN